MKISVFLESCKEDLGFRATCLTFPGLMAEGKTRDLALAALRQLIEDRFAHGEYLQLDVPLPGEPNPWLALAGTWKDKAGVAEFEESIREYRRQVNEDPDRL